MNFIIFYLIIIVQIMLCSAMQPYDLVNKDFPQELCKKISSLFAIDPSKVISLCKQNSLRDQSEKRYCPSNSCVNFIKSTPEVVRQTQQLLNGDKVEPHLQFLLTRSANSISRLEDNFAFRITYGYANTHRHSIILFDELKNKVVVVGMNAPFATINVIDPQKEQIEAEYQLNSHIESVNRGKLYNYPLSLCFHNGPSNWLCSLVVKLAIDGQEEPERDVQKIIFFSDALIPKNVAINASMEIPLIKKHELIGLTTFLVSTGGQLFFGLYNGGNALSLYEQKFSTSITIENQLKKYKRLSVVSFSANQDSDKKTSLGRARFFVILVDNQIEDNQVEQIVFLCDLMSPYNTIKRIWSSDKERKFDRISFFDNTISLWEDAINSSNALKIELPLDWTEMSERSLLFQQACKETRLLSLLNVLK